MIGPPKGFGRARGMGSGATLRRVRASRTSTNKLNDFWRFGLRVRSQTGRRRREMDAWWSGLEWNHIVAFLSNTVCAMKNGHLPGRRSNARKITTSMGTLHTSTYPRRFCFRPVADNRAPPRLLLTADSAWGEHLPAVTVAQASVAPERVNVLFTCTEPVTVSVSPESTKAGVKV
jgi:hypothetical protein